MQTILSTEDKDSKPLSNDESLLQELVTAKTAEAVARQELEEVKGKLDALRKLVAGSPSPTQGGGHRPSPSTPAVSFAVTTGKEAPKMVVPSPSTGGFFSGWGKRSLSTSGPGVER